MTRTELSREPKPIVFGSAASLRPIPGQTSLALAAAGERNVLPALESHHPDCDKLCDQYPGTTRNRCWADAGKDLDETDEN